jgi:hypothetical protein
VELIPGEIDPCEGIEYFRIVVVILLCEGGRTRKTIWQLSAGHEKSVPASKINILVGHGQLDSIPEIHTVTRTTQNEALLWKITDLGIEKTLSWCRNILYLAHTGI